MNLTKKDLKRSAWLILALTLSSGVFAQGTADPKKYQPSKEQSLELRALKAEAQLSQQAFQTAQQQFQQKLAELIDTGKRIQKDNGWPPNLQFDPNTLVYSEPPATPEPAKKP